MNTKNAIANREVFEFKEMYCNENSIIIQLIKDRVAHLIESPVLDVGAGIGDIAYYAFSGLDVTMIDINPPSSFDYKCHNNHKRLVVDFFNYETDSKIATLFISHTLQFIDDDLGRLNDKVRELSPKWIVLVANANNDFIGDLIDWTDMHFENPNPERTINGFPCGYDLIKSEPFSAAVKCPSFECLADQVSYLMLIDLATKRQALINFLKSRLENPEFSFKQTINIYQQHGE